MSNAKVFISNKLNKAVISNTVNFYTSDKFIYIVFDKMPDYNVTGRFTNKITNRVIEIPIEIQALEKGINEFNIPYCTVPVMSLYDPGINNEWKLNIYNSASEEILYEFDLNIRIGKNLFTGKPDLIDESFCGIFLETKA